MDKVQLRLCIKRRPSLNRGAPLLFRISHCRLGGHHHSPGLWAGSGHRVSCPEKRQRILIKLDRCNGIHLQLSSDSILWFLPFWHSGDQHRGLLAVFLILFAEVIDKVTFLQFKRNENVPGRGNGK